MWTYRAKVLRVIDADTLVLSIDMGLFTYRTERIRLMGVNAPELHGTNTIAGQQARAYVVAWCAEANVSEWSLCIATEKGDKYGRWIGTVKRTSDGHCLNDDLLSAGHAVVYGDKVTR